jgi:hypothetical protein
MIVVHLITFTGKNFEIFCNCNVCNNVLADLTSHISVSL